MKINAELIKCEAGMLIFAYNGFTPELECEKKYTIDVKEFKSKRSIEQNSMLWGIIKQISEVTHNEPMDVYISALEHANAKCDWIAGLEEIEDILKKNFRAVKPYGTFLTEDGKQLVRYKVWIGSSKFNTKEMTILIDYLLSVAYELGIQIESEV